MRVDVTIERGHPRNHIIVDGADGKQVLVDVTGLTRSMLTAARSAMAPAIADSIRGRFLRPQDIMVRYAKACADPEHLAHVWQAIPYEERRPISLTEQTAFRSFFAALRRWRLESALYIERFGWYEGMRRNTGPGLLYWAGRHGRRLSATTTTTTWPPTWQIIPAPDVDDFIERWSTPVEEMTQYAMRAGGLNTDEIAAEWPRAHSADASDNFGVSPRRRTFIS